MQSLVKNKNGALMNRLIALCLMLLLSGQAFAQEAPTPHRAPRQPVSQLAIHTNAAPVARDIQGAAMIIDGEKLRVGDMDMRLFGIVPPQLSASFGPQARAALDALVAGQNVSCHIRDRDHDGRLLATCHATSGSDLALELLRHGLAVSARGSLSDTDIGPSYMDAEQAAQNQHLGLWSVVIPSPSPGMTAEASKMAEKTPAVSVPAPTPPPPPTPVVTTSKDEVKKEDVKKDDKTSKPEVQVQSAAASHTVMPPVISHDVEMPVAMQNPNEAAGFFARYQILIAGCLMLITALGVLGALAVQKRRERLDDMKALAAALRGELLAARAVCLTRLKAITSEDDDRAATWPRLRSTLYQAYVGRIGALGAEMARQIASIYGQASDYAAFYSAADDVQILQTPKRQALHNLVGYIETVLPRLQKVEETGRRPPLTKGPTQITLSHVQSVPFHTAPKETIVQLPPQKDIVAASEGDKNGAASSESKTTTVTDDKELPTAQAIEFQTVAPLTQTTNENGGYSQVPGALWDSLRRFARGQFTHQTDEDAHQPMTDYAALIEQDIANMSLNDSEEDMHFGTSDTNHKSGVG